MYSIPLLFPLTFTCQQYQVYLSIEVYRCNKNQLCFDFQKIIQRALCKLSNSRMFKVFTVNSLLTFFSVFNIFCLPLDFYMSAQVNAALSGPINCTDATHISCVLILKRLYRMFEKSVLQIKLLCCTVLFSNTRLHSAHCD